MTASKYLKKLLSLHGIDLTKKIVGGGGCDDAYFGGAEYINAVTGRANALFELKLEYIDLDFSSDSESDHEDNKEVAAMTAVVNAYDESTKSAVQSALGAPVAAAQVAVAPVVAVIPVGPVPVPVPVPVPAVIARAANKPIDVDEVAAMTAVISAYNESPKSLLNKEVQPVASSGAAPQVAAIAAAQVAAIAPVAVAPVAPVVAVIATAAANRPIDVDEVAAMTAAISAYEKESKVLHILGALVSNKNKVLIKDYPFALTLVSFLNYLNKIEYNKITTDDLKTLFAELKEKIIDAFENSNNETNTFYKIFKFLGLPVVIGGASAGLTAAAAIKVLFLIVKTGMTLPELITHGTKYGMIFIKKIFNSDFGTFAKLLTQTIKTAFIKSAKKPVVIPNIKQIPSGIDPSYGGGFILFDEEFNIQNLLHSGYQDTTLMSSNLEDFTDLSIINTFIGELQTKSVTTPPLTPSLTPFDVNTYVEEIKHVLTLPDT